MTLSSYYTDHKLYAQNYLCTKFVVGLGYFLFARHYSGNIATCVALFSIPPGTEMFYFPGIASYIKCKISDKVRRVSPFGNLRIKGC